MLDSMRNKNWIWITAIFLIVGLVIVAEQVEKGRQSVAPVSPLISDSSDPKAYLNHVIHADSNDIVLTVGNHPSVEVTFTNTDSKARTFIPTANFFSRPSDQLGSDRIVYLATTATVNAQTMKAGETRTLTFNALGNPDGMEIRSVSFSFYEP